MCFLTKDPYQSEDLSKFVYKFVYASSNSSYVGQSCRHLATRIYEHFRKDKKSFIYQQLMAFNEFLDRFSKDCFSVLDAANTKHQIRIKESLYITWLEPILNKGSVNTLHHGLSQFIFFCYFSLLCPRHI